VLFRSQYLDPEVVVFKSVGIHLRSDLDGSAMARAAIVVAIYLAIQDDRGRSRRKRLTRHLQFAGRNRLKNPTLALTVGER
jgi:hypothetical protein